MPDLTAYRVPLLEPGTCHRTEITVKKSRFIASAGRGRGPAGCRDFIARIRAEFPDARHNCYAFNGGGPDSGQCYGSSDDGEPHGTAGRPMLSLVSHCGIGEICCVVTRYFGGILLGTGGLVKAYQDAVRQVLATLPAGYEDAVAEAEITVPAKFAGSVRPLFCRQGCSVVSEQYAEAAVFRVRLPESLQPALCAELQSLTAGTAVISILPES